MRVASLSFLEILMVENEGISMREIHEKGNKKIVWSSIRPKKSDFIAGLIVGLICVILLASIFVANYLIVGL